MEKPQLPKPIYPELPDDPIAEMIRDLVFETMKKRATDFVAQQLVEKHIRP